MSKPLVECIANFSEARRPEVVSKISDAITSVQGVILLDQHSDMDHNRTVLTFVGTPGEIEQAAYQAIAKAAELINLEEHRGEHPRIGAADVVPFVPISGVTMQECVEIACSLGSRVGKELGIPVYLYEEAAANPERRNLENIRRGEYEALKTEIEENEDRAPDFGPKKLGPAGATAIGAREPLIAYNIFLNTDDVEIARQIAGAVRHSSGGLRYVKALGMLVDGKAQVSMNLTNFRKTPPARVVEMVRREAARFGVSIKGCELVGLIPQEALLDAAVWYLQLEGFKKDQILESRLAGHSVERVEREQLKAEDQAGFLEKLAAGTPVPGGGSAAAFSGAAGAALVEMVARLTIGKKKYAEVESEMQSVLVRATKLRNDLTRAVDLDAAAYNSVLEAYKKPKENSKQEKARSEAIMEAILVAANVPLNVAEMAVLVMDLAFTMVSKGNLNAISDAATGAALAKAAIQGAGYNVRINAAQLENQDQSKELYKKISTLEENAEILDKKITMKLQERGGFSLS